MGGTNSTIVEEIFELVDPDRSGSLNAQEYKEFMDHLSTKKEWKTFLPDMKLLDKDGDEEVSLEELKNYFGSKKLQIGDLHALKQTLVQSIDSTYANEDFCEVKSSTEDEEAKSASESDLPIVSRQRDGTSGSSNRSTRTNRDDSKGSTRSVSPRSRREQAGKGEGLIWHAQVVPDDYRHKKHCTEEGILRPKRPRPHIYAKNFFSQIELEQTSGMYVFPGLPLGLNQWGGLRELAVLSITYKEKGLLGSKIVRSWTAPNIKRGKGKKESKAILPKYPSVAEKKKRSVRVTLQAPCWTNRGWSEDSPGHAWWFFACRPRAQRRLRFGTRMKEQLRNFLAKEQKKDRAAVTIPKATMIHQFAHRYALGKRKEGMKDKLTYHAGILLEWDHGKHCTVIELAWLNGIGGYGGRSNWVPDKDSGRPVLYRAMPSIMKMPWRTERAEVRAIDIDCKNKEEFERYLKKYSGPGLRFLDPQVSASAPVRVTLRDQTHIMTYLLNYVLNEGKYDELTRNCQDFAADFYGFMAGLSPEQSKPFHAVCRLTYTPHRHLFLYDPKSDEKKSTFSTSTT